MNFPLPEPSHYFEVGDRAFYVIDQAAGEIIEISTDRGPLELPYCLMRWDDGGTAGIKRESWVLMQHLWPEDGRQAAEALEASL